MKSYNIRYLVIFAIICISGIIISQIYWFKRAFDLKEKQFTQTVIIALQNVAETIMTFNHQIVPIASPVNEISGNYYSVMINSEIETNTLEFLLKNEFQKRNLLIDFEYGVYSCQTGKMVYGNYISTGFNPLPGRERELPVWKNDSYYFSIFFPDKPLYLSSQMGIWLFSSLVLFLVCVFFGYSLFIILQQKRFSEIQGDFINNMTHEFNTPITSILIISQILNKKEVGRNFEKVSEYSGLITLEATRLKDQIEKILHLAVMEKHKEIYTFSPIDIHQIILDTIKSIESRVLERKGCFITTLEADHTLVHGDTVHLMNALYNLFDNSIKYNHNAPEIKISSQTIGKKVRIIISDNGVGIDAGHQKMIFHKFFRVPTGNIHNVKGFGIGLYYVKKVVVAHKGTINLTSLPQHGTRVTLILPLAKPHETK